MWWPASRMPTIPIPRARRPSVRWPGCATTAGSPRSSCPPRRPQPSTPNLPGFSSDVRVTRTELEQLIAEPLNGLLNTVEETLQRNNIALSDISAVATVGGGANIPLVTQQLSTRLRAPVVTTPQSQLNVAAGAAVLADSAEAATGMATAADAPTGMAPTAGWVAGRSGSRRGRAAAADAPGSSTFRALAWSQDDAPAGAASPCPTPARTTPSTQRPPARPAHRWSSATRRRASPPNPDHCPGTSARRSCSGLLRPPCCWPSAASRSH